MCFNVKKRINLKKKNLNIIGHESHCDPQVYRSTDLDLFFVSNEPPVGYMYSSLFINVVQTVVTACRLDS